MNWFTSYPLRLWNSVRSVGVAGTIASVAKRPLRATPLFQDCVRGRKGLEIGGPSPFFRSFLPIYECVEALDNCVFANTTVWEGHVKEPFEYDPTKPAGHNYIADGADLGQFADASYDFVLSCHNLEHIANPLKALKDWIRVIRPQGSIILVLPDGRRTFDHRRPPTPLSHMLADYAAGVREDDLTHLDEILAKHDLSRDPNAGDRENFRQRSLRNLEFRCLHHHVFDTENVRALLESAGLKVIALETALPFHIAALATSDGTPCRP